MCTLPLKSSFNVSYLSGLSHALTLEKKERPLAHFARPAAQECHPVLDIPIWKPDVSLISSVGCTTIFEANYRHRLEVSDK